MAPAKFGYGQLEAMIDLGTTLAAATAGMKANLLVGLVVALVLFLRTVIIEVLSGSDR